MIRLYVIEDHEAIIVSGLKRMFYSSRDGIEVIGSSKSVEQAIESVKPEEFDIFILDLWLESRSPLRDINTLKEAFPGKNIMIYTSETSVSWRIRMFEEGALAFITKTADRAEIKTAIKNTAAGRSFYPIDIGNFTEKKALITIDNGGQLISPVQRDIINMLENGYSHQEIAEVIGRSRSGLADILKGMRKKFNAKTITELVTIVKNLS
ncbi:MAG: response regulator transcription factor [Bacteroidota bacterium]|nr:response regulator transcription factor [Bacteroidota bacterium]